MDKISQLTSEDIVKSNIEKLQEIFPTVFSEGKILVDELEALLGNYVEKDKEFFQMTWAGKTAAQKEAQKVSTGTLRPCKEDSKDWDNTGNILVEGDNLEVLKLLQKSYSNKIKMIYIDPPYNTGKDFVYKDNYKDNLSNYLDITGQTDSEGKKITTNTESDGRYHSNWLNMMYPRLKLARNLMTDDGVIFISIDDNEQANLKKVCDEVFGEENFISNLVWQKKTGASDSISISTITENILVFCKNISCISSTFTKNQESFDLNRYRFSDKYFNERGPYYIDNLDRGGLQYSDSLNFGIECPDKSLTYPNGRKDYINDGWIWKWSKKKIEWAKANDFLEIKKSDKKKSGWAVYYKNYLKVDNENKPIERSAPHKNLIISILNASSSVDIKKIFVDRVFQYAKPVNLVRHLVSLINIEDNDIVFDFFSGSGTTAHAVMALNAEDGGNRKCISVQLPEPTDEKSEAFKAGYHTISEITKERIRRAGELVKEENKDKEGIEKLDTGFRVFKLDSSNIQAWDTAVEKFEEQLDIFEANNGDAIKTDRTEEDVLYEIILKYGLDLTLPIQEKVIADTTIYNIGFGAMYICLGDKIEVGIAKAIGEWHKESSDSNPSVIFKDSGFATDAVKTNTIQTLRQAGIENVKSI